MVLTNTKTGFLGRVVQVGRDALGHASIVATALAEASATIESSLTSRRRYQLKVGPVAAPRLYKTAAEARHACAKIGHTLTGENTYGLYYS